MQSNVYHVRWKSGFKHKGFSACQDATSIQDWAKSVECPLFTPHSKANLHSSHVMITMNKLKRVMFPKIPTTKCSNCDTLTHIANDDTKICFCNCDIYISLKYWRPFWIVVLCVNIKYFYKSIWKLIFIYCMIKCYSYYWMCMHHVL
jgi:hypothetical protein